MSSPNPQHDPENVRSDDVIDDFFEQGVGSIQAKSGNNYPPNYKQYEN